MRSHLLGSAPRLAPAWSYAAIAVGARAQSLLMLVDVPHLRPSIRSVGILARDKITLVATDHARADDRMRARNRSQQQAGRLNALERSSAACHERPAGSICAMAALLLSLIMAPGEGMGSTTGPYGS